MSIITWWKVVMFLLFGNWFYNFFFIDGGYVLELSRGLKFNELSHVVDSDHHTTEFKSATKAHKSLSLRLQHLSFYLFLTQMTKLTFIGKGSGSRTLSDLGCSYWVTGEAILKVSLVIVSSILVKPCLMYIVHHQKKNLQSWSFYTIYSSR